jgi:hypothetical protein
MVRHANYDGGEPPYVALSARAATPLRDQATGGRLTGARVYEATRPLVDRGAIRHDLPGHQEVPLRTQCATTTITNRAMSPPVSATIIWNGRAARGARNKIKIP